MYLPYLYPAPASFSEDETKQFSFGEKVTATLSGSLSRGTVSELCDLWRRFTHGLSELIITRSTGTGHSLTVGTPGACLPDPGDRYALRVDESGIRVVAPDEKGLVNGFMTLLQLICPTENGDFRIASATVHDRPAFPFRAVHLCVFPETDLYQIERAIRLAGFLKMTHIILEFWGTIRFDCLPALAWRDRSFGKEEIRPLVALAHTLGMEVIPMMNHFGHASQSRCGMGRHTVLDNDPRLSFLFEPDGWTWCLSSERTWDLLSEIRGELYDLAGEGEYIHLGFDEAYSFATCPRCRARVPHELLAEYLNRLTDDVASHGRRPIIWHDELIAQDTPLPIRNEKMVANGARKHTDRALDLLDRRIIIADWQYGYTDDRNPSTPYFQEKGFDVILCPWDQRANVAALTKSAASLGAFGVMLTTWHHLGAFFSSGAQFADFLWSGGKNGKRSETEAAALLRSLAPADGDFTRAGWSRFETDPI